MAIAYNSTIRTAQLQVVADAVNAGSTGGLIRLYSGTRPATGGAITTQTLLAELTFNATMENAGTGGSITNGVLTAATITSDSSANATDTATWFRVVDSDGTFVLDGDVGTSGSDLNLNTTSIVSTVPVTITSFVITAGNA